MAMMGTPAPAGSEIPPASSAGMQDGASAQERREIDQWERRIMAVRHAESEHYRKIQEHRDTLAGDHPADGVLGEQLNEDGILTAPMRRQETNIIFGTFAAALPLIYDTEPDVSAVPAPAASDIHYELARGFARTAEVVLRRRYVKDTMLRARMESTTRGTMPDGIGWVKLAYVRDYRTEPVFKVRVEDAQDEIQRLSYLTQTLAAETDRDKVQDLAGQVQDLRSALMGQQEVLIREGLVIEMLDALDIVVDPAVRNVVGGYVHGRWIAQGLWLDPDTAAEMYNLTKEERKQVKLYESRRMPGGLAPPEMSMSEEKASMEVSFGQTADMEAGALVRVWEIWDKTTMTVRTMIEGLMRWAKPHMRPERRPMRWYPYYNLGFNIVEGRRYPLSDVGLLEQLQKDFHDTRTKFKMHRDATIPKTGLAADKIDPVEAQKFVNAPVGSVVPIKTELGPEVALERAFFVPEYPLPPPVLYDTAPIRTDMTQVFGLGDAQRGAMVAPKTATEANQIQAAVRGRTSTRTDAIVALETEMAMDALEILLMELPLEAVQRVAGMDAVWPQMTRSEIEDLVSIDLRHSSREDKDARRLAWMEIEMRVQQLIGTVIELRMQGLELFAQPFIEILRETLKRYDERLDVERFLPASPTGDTVLPELEEAAARGVGPISGDMLAQIMTGMGVGGVTPAGGGGGGGGGGSPYNPGAGGVGGPQPAGDDTIG